MRGGAGRGGAGLVKRGVGGGAIFMRAAAEPINISCAVFEEHSNIQGLCGEQRTMHKREREREERERERERERGWGVGGGGVGG